MTGANLLHATAAKRALRAIHELGTVHHLVLRSNSPRPSWGTHGTAEFGGGVLLDPAAGTLPVLLAAAGSPIIDVSATAELEGIVDTQATLALRLGDGRTIGVHLSWTDGPSDTEVEAAGETGVVMLRLWPRPALEIDGRQIALPEEPPLVALGFTEQMRRFAAVAAGRDAAWPPRSVGDGVMAIAEAAARSAVAGGAVTIIDGPAVRDPATVFADAT